MAILSLKPHTHLVDFRLTEDNGTDILEEVVIRHSSVKTLVARLRAGKRAQSETSIEIDELSLITKVYLNEGNKPVDRTIILHIGRSAIDLELDEADALADILDNSANKSGSSFRIQVDLIELDD